MNAILTADTAEPTLEELLEQIACLDAEGDRRDRERDRLATRATIENFKRFINRTVSADAMASAFALEIRETPPRAHVSRPAFTREELTAAWIGSDHTSKGLAWTLGIPEGSLGFYLKKVCLTMAELRSLEVACNSASAGAKAVA